MCPGASGAWSCRPWHVLGIAPSVIGRLCPSVPAGRSCRAHGDCYVARSLVGGRAEELGPHSEAGMCV